MLAVALVHAVRAAAAEQREHTVGGVPLPEAAGEVVEGGLVLREHDEALVGPERRLVLRAASRLDQQSLDQRHERVEPRIGGRRLLGDRRIVEVEAQGVERLLDVADLLVQVVGEVPEPSAGDGRGGGFALLSLAVVAGLLAQRALGRRHVFLGGRFRARKALPGPAPGIGERGGAREQTLAQDLDRERARAASGRRSRRHEPAHGGAEGVEGVGELGFVRLGIEGERLRRTPRAESRRCASGVDVALQPADHDVLDAPAHRRAHLAAAGEPHGIEYLQQPRERARVAVVGRRRKEQAVLELRRQEAQHPAELAVLAEGRGHQVVALVDDQ